jgi:hypothetical protein
MDLGGLQGGFSLFPKRWGWDPRAVVRLHHWEQEDKLRLLCVHTTDIQPGDTWSSGEYILTPHRGGWAKGIEPYRDWVRKNTGDRPWPVPKHVREGLGYRTIWMSLGYENDPDDIIWHMSDLEALAKESCAHGLDEMVIWGMMRFFKLPLPDPLPHLGTLDDLRQAVCRCREIGVNLAPFISILQVGTETAHKYGLTVPEQGGWAQHTETIPRFQAPYVPLYRSVGVDPANELWQKEVLMSCRRYIEAGIPSISWDQYWSTPEGHQNRLGAAIRDMAYARDAEATFSGEELWNLEVDWRELDYTWNWGSYRDCQAFTSAFPSPRISCNVDSCAMTAYQGFMDNLYLNVFPRKPNSVNGSDWIANHAALSDALKRCAALRRQFLAYFTEGTFIGNCILCESCPEAHVSAYVMPAATLVLVLNLGTERTIDLVCDPRPWVSASGPQYQVTFFDQDGTQQEERQVSAGALKLTTPILSYLGLCLYEIKA